MEIPELSAWYKFKQPVEYKAKKLKQIRDRLLQDDWAIHHLLLTSSKQALT